MAAKLCKILTNIEMEKKCEWKFFLQEKSNKKIEQSFRGKMNVDRSFSEKSLLWLDGVSMKRQILPKTFKLNPSNKQYRRQFHKNMDLDIKDESCI